jgi:hypothetical protein
MATAGPSYGVIPGQRRRMPDGKTVRVRLTRFAPEKTEEPDGEYHINVKTEVTDSNGAETPVGEVIWRRASVVSKWPKVD